MDKNKIEARYSEKITTYAARLVDCAKECGGPVSGEFNGIKLQALPDSAPSDLVERYWFEMHKAECETPKAKTPREVADVLVREALVGTDIYQEQLQLLAEARAWIELAGYLEDRE